MSLATVERAKRVIGTLKAHKTEAMLTRRQWMQDNGQNPKDAPPLSLHPRWNPKARRPVIHVNGRDLTPGERAVTRPNRPQPQRPRLHLGHLDDPQFGQVVMP